MPDQNKKSLKYARQLRNEPTPFEEMLWAQLRSSQLNGHKFRRQHVIDHIIADFFCPQKGLIVEVDGDTHDPMLDERRDAAMLKLGFQTRRYTNADVGQNIEGVLSDLLSLLDGMPDRWDGPTPTPPLKGRGYT